MLTNKLLPRRPTGNNLYIIRDFDGVSNREFLANLFSVFFTFWLKFGRKRGLLQVINDLNESNA